MDLTFPGSTIPAMPGKEKRVLLDAVTRYDMMWGLMRRAAFPEEIRL